MSTNRSEDQVARRLEFNRIHPEVDFKFCRETGHWEASYPTEGNDVETVRGSELKGVLNELEERFG